MGIFDKLKKKPKKTREKAVKREKPVKPAEKEKAVKKPKKEKEVKKINKVEKAEKEKPKKETPKPKVKKEKTGEVLIDKFLKEPLITEKATDLAKDNKYVFKVNQRADKKNIKRAIEEMYSVEVTKVNIINLPSKSRRLGRAFGFKSGFKKAIVTLREGDKIEVIKGV
jgi:large subunit ribosomal protein L23